MGSRKIPLDETQLPDNCGACGTIPILFTNNIAGKQYYFYHCPICDTFSQGKATIEYATLWWNIFPRRLRTEKEYNIYDFIYHQD